MPASFLRAFIANLGAHKLLSLITVLSLSIGLTAVVLNRRKEIGIRKACGAGKGCCWA